MIFGKDIWCHSILPKNGLAHWLLASVADARIMANIATRLPFSQIAQGGRAKNARAVTPDVLSSKKRRCKNVKA